LKKEKIHIEPIGGSRRKEGKYRTTNKSFLVLFFKKELLSFFHFRKETAMLFARALLFNNWFFGITALLGIAALPVRAFARPFAYRYARAWIRLVLAGARVICGIRIELSGTEFLPREGPALIASQHQSAFDTLVWLTLVPHASYVVKQELTSVPLFGPMLVPAGMIPVDRAGGAAALRELLHRAAAARDAGRQIVIFPEGTRVAPGARVRLQPGIVAVARHLGLPVIPVATDSGLCWGRRAFLKKPGSIHIALGRPVPAGTGRDALIAAIEAHWHGNPQAPEPVDKSVGKIQGTV
jgi:1-acyl-sn-glycerol-3-phosphate acyltransferase